MQLAIFGLTVTSSWGNGHATLWRGLIRALARRGHGVSFFEKDQPCYAAQRDLSSLPGCELYLYDDFAKVSSVAKRALTRAGAAIVTSYCPDALAATELMLGSPVPVRCFYDLDTPVTLSRLRENEKVDYLGPDRLCGFDVVFSYTGGPALEALTTGLGARRVVPLYGSVDPEVYRPVPSEPSLASDLSYLGTYAADRQKALEELFLRPARCRSDRPFLLSGAMYPEGFPWTDNVWSIPHVPPPRHAALFSSSRFTLNLTRRAMAELGYCPSGRLFEAAACATPILSDWWEGLDAFFEPGEELLVVRRADDVLEALELEEPKRLELGRAARKRVLSEHTADHRAQELLDVLENGAELATGR